MLTRLHFTVPHKPPRATTPAARAEARARLLAEFTIHAHEVAERSRVIFLLVHDARFVPLVESLQRKGKRVFIISTRSMLAPELARAADKPIFFLEDLQAFLDEAEDDFAGLGP